MAITCGVKRLCTSQCIAKNLESNLYANVNSCHQHKQCKLLLESFSILIEFCKVCLKYKTISC